MPEVTPEEGKLIGEVTHYFGNIGVVVIELKDALKEGDTIRIEGGAHSFEQAVESMEVDRKKVTQAKAGESVGLKVTQKAKEGYRVYKI